MALGAFWHFSCLLFYSVSLMKRGRCPKLSKSSQNLHSGNKYWFQKGPILPSKSLEWLLKGIYVCQKPLCYRNEIPTKSNVVCPDGKPTALHFCYGLKFISRKNPNQNQTWLQHLGNMSIRATKKVWSISDCWQSVCLILLPSAWWTQRRT